MNEVQEVLERLDEIIIGIKALMVFVAILIGATLITPKFH